MITAKKCRTLRNQHVKTVTFSQYQKRKIRNVAKEILPEMRKSVQETLEDKARAGGSQESYFLREIQDGSLHLREQAELRAYQTIMRELSETGFTVKYLKGTYTGSSDIDHQWWVHW